MQVSFYRAGEITQVKESIPWVRCASGNVYFYFYMFLTSPASLFPYLFPFSQSLSINLIRLKGTVFERTFWSNLIWFWPRGRALRNGNHATSHKPINFGSWTQIEILVTRYVCSSISPGFKYSNAKILCKRRHYINISRNLRKCILEDWMKQKVRQGDFACLHLYSTRADGAEKSDIFSAFFSSTWCKTHELLYFSQPGGLPERTAFKKTPLKLTIVCESEWIYRIV